MKSILKRLIFSLVVTCILVGSVPEVYAGTKLGLIDESKMSSSYKKSKYYTLAKTAYEDSIKLGLSDAERFVRVALSQKGYTATAKKAGYGGSGNPKGSYTEYSRWMKVNGKDWCASFVSWAAAAAGISNKVIVRGAGAGHFRNAAPNGGKFTRIWSDDFKTYKDFKPQVGDLVLITPLCSKCGKHRTAFKPTSHVAIVASVNNTKNKDGSWSFTTIERAGNVVGCKKMTTKSRKGKASCKCKSQKKTGITNVPAIQGFFRPKWEKTSSGAGAGNQLVSVAAAAVTSLVTGSNTTPGTNTTAGNGTSSGTSANGNTSAG